MQIQAPGAAGKAALQVTFGTGSVRKLSKPKAGHFAKARVGAGAKLVELQVDGVIKLPGRSGDHRRPAVSRRAWTTAGRQARGKGFAGTMKRHNSAVQGHARHASRAPQARFGGRLRHAGPGVQGHPHGRAHRWVRVTA